MTTEVLTTIAAQQTADLQRVAKQLGADFVPYAKRIESGVFDILEPYEDKSITKKRQDKILKDIGTLTNLEYKEYNKYLDTQMKLVSAEEVTTGVMALDTAIISDVDINEPKKSDVTTAVIGTPIQQGDKSWTTYRGSQDAFKSSYVSEINSATLASMQGASTGKDVADALYSQIHYTGRKASKSVLDRSRRSANSLSATLTNHTANVTRVQFGEANSKLVKGYVFIAVLDSQTSQTCRQGDQTTMTADNPKFSAWSPPRHRGCRSAISYDVDDRYKLDEKDTKRASSFTKDGLRDPKPVSSGEMYYQQLLDAKMSADDMDRVMGATLGKAFRKGIKDKTLTPESFAKMTVNDLNFSALTVKQMSARSNALGDILRKQSGSKKKPKPRAATKKPEVSGKPKASAGKVKLPPEALRDIKPTARPLTKLDKGITDKERDLLISYTGEGYEGLNSRARGEFPNFLDPSNPEHVAMFNDGVAEARRKQKALDAMINKSSVSSSATVYRGVDSKELFDGVSDKDVGKVLSVDTVQSATYSKDTALSFTEGSSPVMFKIAIPKGASALDVSKTGIPTFGESEILLPSTTKYRVVSVDESKDSSGKVILKTINVELI